MLIYRLARVSLRLKVVWDPSVIWVISGLSGSVGPGILSKIKNGSMHSTLGCHEFQKFAMQVEKMIGLCWSEGGRAGLGSVPADWGYSSTTSGAV